MERFTRIARSTISSQAIESAEAYAGAGFSVAMISATGRYLMGFEPRLQRVAV